MDNDVWVPGTRLDTVQVEPIQWIVPNRLATGFLTLLDGDPGLGKSTLITDWVARITTGRGVLGGPSRPPAGAVLLSGEDDLAATIRPRMEAAGADLSRIISLNSVPDIGAFGSAADSQHPISLPADLFYLELAVRNVGAKIVVIDPVMLYMDEKVNENNASSVRRALDPLKTFAEREKLAVILVRHLNKRGEGPAIYRGQGSIAWTGMARWTFLLGQHPDEEDRVVLATVKANVGKRARSLTFHIESAPDNPDIGHVVYDGECGLRADDLTGYLDRDEREERRVCREWLKQSLVWGAVEHRELIKKANAAGFNIALVRACLSSLGAVRTVVGQKTDWSLPAAEPVWNTPQTAPPDDYVEWGEVVA